MPPFYVQTPPPRITAEMSFRVSSISLPTIAADMEFGSGPIASHNIIPAAARPDSSDDEDGPPLGQSRLVEPFTVTEALLRQQCEYQDSETCRRAWSSPGDRWISLEGASVTDGEMARGDI